MIRVLFVAIAISLASCQPAAGPSLDNAERDVIKNARLLRACPDGLSRIYVAADGTRYFFTERAYVDRRLAIVATTTNLKDVC